MKQRSRGKLVGILLAAFMTLMMLPMAVSAADEELETAAAGTEVYLDGMQGKDTNSGVDKANAVKTLEKAKELAGSDGTILICGEVSLYNAGEVILSDVHIKRADSYDGTLIGTWGAKTTLTVSNTTIDGNKENVTTDSGYLINVLEGSTLNIQEGRGCREIDSSKQGQI